MRWHRSSCLASGERSCPRLFSPASESTRDSRLRVRRVVSASRQVSPPHGDLGNRVKDPPTTWSVSGRSGGDGWRRGAAGRGGGRGRGRNGAMAKLLSIHGRHAPNWEYASWSRSTRTAAPWKHGRTRVSLLATNFLPLVNRLRTLRPFRARTTK